MLKIVIPATEFYDMKRGEFIQIKEQALQLEHSLVSISKWEAIWKKPFLSNTDKTMEETISYIECMTTTQNVDPNVYLAINRDILKNVSEYIDDPMTATTFSNDNRMHHNREIITSELIYYWMIYHGIPFECRKWHLNRLLTLINICSLKEQPAQKMPMSELMARNKSLNAARRKKYGTRG